MVDYEERKALILGNLWVFPPKNLHFGNSRKIPVLMNTEYFPMHQSITGVFIVDIYSSLLQTLVCKTVLWPFLEKY